MKNELKTAILKSLSEKIESNEMDWASMYIVEQYQLAQDIPDESEIAKARLKMKEIEERLKWLRSYHAKELSE